MYFDWTNYIDILLSNQKWTHIIYVIVENQNIYNY